MLTPSDIAEITYIARHTQSDASRVHGAYVDGVLLFLILFNMICGVSHLLHLAYHKRRRDRGVDPCDTSEL